MVCLSSVDSTEMGTSTQVETSRAIDIKFSNSGLTYAERLLLKKHRRGDRSMLAEAHVTDPDVGMKAGTCKRFQVLPWSLFGVTLIEKLTERPFWNNLSMGIYFVTIFNASVFQENFCIP